MRLVEILQIVGALCAAFGSISAAAEKRFVGRLRAAGARSADEAIMVAAMGRLTRWRVARLEKAGAVAAADGGRYYLCEDEYRRMRWTRRKRALTLVAAVVVVILVLVAVL